jgi:hypothetical protein
MKMAEILALLGEMSTEPNMIPLFSNYIPLLIRMTSCRNKADGYCQLTVIASMLRILFPNGAMCMALNQYPQQTQHLILLNKAWRPIRNFPPSNMHYEQVDKRLAIISLPGQLYFPVI